MRASVLSGYGGPEVLELADVAEPEPGPGQVRISVAAAAVNPVDLGTRSGGAARAIPDPHFPMILGWDAAGTVDATGEGVTRFQPGDRVIAMSLWFATRAGTYAERVVLDEGAVAPAPEGVDDDAAATIPLNGLTAWSALAVARLAPGDRLLVAGAAGGVGGYLVELARSRGIHVIGYGRTSDLDTIASLGADQAIDDLAACPPVTAAVDTTGTPTPALAAVEPGGRLLTVSGKVTDEKEGVTVKAVGVRNDAAALAELAAMAAAGTLTLRVADVMDLGQAAAAHRRFEGHGVRGRLVLRP